MTDHPSTYRADPENVGNIDWDDRASLHLKGDSDGVLGSMKRLRSGTFAELISQVMAMPAEDREKYVIEKAGDREFSAGEIEGLSKRDDFPG